MWHVNNDGAIPPLPRVVCPDTGEDHKKIADLLKPGCWNVRLDPIPADDFNAARNLGSHLKGWTVSYVGTLRINQEDEGIRASGDLYLEREDWSTKGTLNPPPLLPAGEIPIYRRRDYSAYFTLKNVSRDLQTLTIAFYRFNPKDNTWGPEDILTATRATLAPTPASTSERADQLFWSVKNDCGSPVASLRIAWISDYLRLAKIDVACAAGIKPALDNGAGVKIEDVFKKVNWQLEKIEPLEVEGPPEVWQEKELHARMLKLRRAVDLDRMWTYHVLVVPRWQDSEEFFFGKMYDAGAVDTNLVPREGLVVAATAKFPDDERFGSARGQKLMNVPKAAFHNLMHELGHAMGLLHRFYGKGFMQALAFIAYQVGSTASSSAAPSGDHSSSNPQPLPFPDNLEFRYDPEDLIRLRHYPDMWTRPGGVPFAQGFSALPIPDADAITDVGGQLALTARPLRRKVPLGAPVKLQLRLTNISKGTLPGPAVLSLSDGSVAGRVIGPGGQSQSFSGAAPIDYTPTASLASGGSLFHGETLLRGPQGALFPGPGRYRIEVDAGWVGPGGIARVSTACEVVVTPPCDRRHKRVAREALAAEGLSILLIFRPDPGSEAQPGNEALAKAVEVLHQALKTPELRDSFAPVEARRLGETDLPAAARLIEKTSLMTTSEIEHLLTLAHQAKRKDRRRPEVRRMIEICRAKARRAVCKNLAPQSLLDLALDLLRCC